jgi:hypothetical protein
MNLSDIKAAVRRLSVEERGRLVLWLANGMPQEDEPEEDEREGRVRKVKIVYQKREPEPPQKINIVYKKPNEK